MNLSRRGFLGLFAGAVAMPIIASIIKPKRSFFFFPAKTERVSFVDEPFDIHKAINALSPSGGTVRIPAGTWILNKSFFIPNNVVLRGEGPLNIASCHVMTFPDRKDAILEVSDTTTINGCVFEGGGGVAFAMAPPHA